MIKRLAVYFGMLGYLMAVLRYTPHSWSLPHSWWLPLWYACVGCPNVDPSPGAIGTLLFLALAEALIYTGLGFILGKFIQKCLGVSTRRSGF